MEDSWRKALEELHGKMLEIYRRANPSLFHHGPVIDDFDDSYETWRPLVEDFRKRLTSAQLAADQSNLAGGRHIRNQLQAIGGILQGAVEAERLPDSFHSAACDLAALTSLATSGSLEELEKRWRAAVDVANDTTDKEQILLSLLDEVGDDGIPVTMLTESPLQSSLRDLLISADSKKWVEFRSNLEDDAWVSLEATSVEQDTLIGKLRLLLADNRPLPLQVRCRMTDDGQITLSQSNLVNNWERDLTVDKACRDGCVVLYGKENPVKVLGKRKEPLPEKRYRIIATLIDYSNDGKRVTRKDLGRDSRQSNTEKPYDIDSALMALREDSDWAQVIRSESGRGNGVWLEAPAKA